MGAGGSGLSSTTRYWSAYLFFDSRWGPGTQPAELSLKGGTAPFCLVFFGVGSAGFFDHGER